MAAEVEIPESISITKAEREEKELLSELNYINFLPDEVKKLESRPNQHLEVSNYEGQTANTPLAINIEVDEENDVTEVDVGTNEGESFLKSPPVPKVATDESSSTPKDYEATKIHAQLVEIETLEEELLKEQQADKEASTDEQQLSAEEKPEESQRDERGGLIENELVMLATSGQNIESLQLIRVSEIKEEIMSNFSGIEKSSSEDMKGISYKSGEVKEMESEETEKKTEQHELLHDGDTDVCILAAEHNEEAIKNDDGAKENIGSLYVTALIEENSSEEAGPEGGRPSESSSIQLEGNEGTNMDLKDENIAKQITEKENFTGPLLESTADGTVSYCQEEETNAEGEELETFDATQDIIGEEMEESRISIQALASIKDDITAESSPENETTKEKPKQEVSETSVNGATGTGVQIIEEENKVNSFAASAGENPKEESPKREQEESVMEAREKCDNDRTTKEIEEQNTEESTNKADLPSSAGEETAQENLKEDETDGLKPKEELKNLEIEGTKSFDNKCHIEDTIAEDMKNDRKPDEDSNVSNTQRSTELSEEIQPLEINEDLVVSSSMHQVSQKDTEDDNLEKAESMITELIEETSIKEVEQEHKTESNSSDLFIQDKIWETETGLDDVNITAKLDEATEIGEHTRLSETAKIEADEAGEETVCEAIATLPKGEDESKDTSGEAPLSYVSELTLEDSSAPLTTDSKLGTTEARETINGNPENIEVPSINIPSPLTAETTEEMLEQKEDEPMYPIDGTLMELTDIKMDNVNAVKKPETVEPHILTSSEDKSDKTLLETNQTKTDEDTENVKRQNLEAAVEEVSHSFDTTAEEKIFGENSQRGQNGRSEEVEPKSEAEHQIYGTQYTIETMNNVILTEEVLRAVEKAEESENIKEQIVEEGSCTTELLQMPSSSVHEPNKVPASDLDAAENLEAAGIIENAETVGLQAIKDITWEPEASSITKAPEEEMMKGAEKPINITSSASELSKENVGEEKMEEVGNHGEKTETAQATVMTAETSSEGVHLGNNSARDLDITSGDNSPRVHTTLQCEAADNVELEDSSVISQLNTTEHAGVNKETVVVENPATDEIEVELLKISDAEPIIDNSETEKLKAVEDINWDPEASSMTKAPEELMKGGEKPINITSSASELLEENSSKEKMEGVSNHGDEAETSTATIMAAETSPEEVQLANNSASDLDTTTGDNRLGVHPTTQGEATHNMDLEDSFQISQLTTAEHADVNEETAVVESPATDETEVAELNISDAAPVIEIIETAKLQVVEDTWVPEASAITKAAKEEMMKDAEKPINITSSVSELSVENPREEKREEAGNHGDEAETALATVMTAETSSEGVQLANVSARDMDTLDDLELQDSSVIYQLTTTEHADVNKETMEVEKSATGETEVEELKNSNAEPNSNEQHVHIHESEEISTVKSPDINTYEEETNEVQSIPEVKYQVVQAVAEGDKFPDPTHPAGNLTGQFQTPSSATLLKEQELQTAATTEKVEDESPMKEETPVNEKSQGTTATITKEDTCLPESKLEVSTLELALVEAKQNESPDKLAKEETADVQKTTAEEPRECISMIQLVDTLPDGQENMEVEEIKHFSSLEPSKEETLDSPNEENEDVFVPQSLVKSTLSREAPNLECQEIEKVAESASDLQSPEVLTKLEETETKDEHIEVAAAELRDEENLNEKLNEEEITESGISSEKTAEVKEDEKDSSVVSLEVVHIQKLVQELKTVGENKNADGTDNNRCPQETEEGNLEEEPIILDVQETKWSDTNTEAKAPNEENLETREEPRSASVLMVEEQIGETMEEVDNHRDEAETVPAIVMEAETSMEGVQLASEPAKDLDTTAGYNSLGFHTTLQGEAVNNMERVDSSVISQLTTTEHADVNKETMAVEKSATNETEIEELKFSNADPNSNEQDASDSDKISTVKSSDINTYEKETNYVLDSVSETKYQVVEAVAEGDRIPDPTPLAENLTEDFQTPSSTTVLEEQEWQTTNTTEKVEDESPMIEETLVNEKLQGTIATNTKEETCSSESELEVSTLELELVEAKKNDRPGESQNEETTDLNKTTPEEPQDYISMIQLTDTPSDGQENMEVEEIKHFSSLEPSKEETMDSENSNKENEDLLVPHFQVKSMLPQEATKVEVQEIENAAESATDLQSPEVLTKSEEAEMKEEHVKVAATELTEEENLKEKLNEEDEITDDGNSSEKTAEVKEETKDSSVMSLEVAHIQELAQELETVGENENITKPGKAAEDSYQDSTADGTDNNSCPQETEEERKVEEAPIRLDLQETKWSEKNTEAKAANEEKKNLKTHEEPRSASVLMVEEQINKTPPEPNKLNTDDNSNNVEDNLGSSEVKINEQDSKDEEMELTDEVELENQINRREDCIETIKDVILSEEIEEVTVENQEAKKSEDIKEEIVEEDSCIRELQKPSASDETINEITHSDPMPVEKPEATDLSLETKVEELRAGEDLNLESEASPITEASEKEMNQGTEKPVNITSSVLEVSVEETGKEKMQEVANDNEKIDTQPVTLISETSLEEVQQGEKLIKGSQAENQIEKTDEANETTEETLLREKIAEDEEVAREFLATNSIEELSEELLRVDAPEKAKENVTGARKAIVNSDQDSVAEGTANENLPQETTETKNVNEPPSEIEIQETGNEMERTEIDMENIVLSEEITYSDPEPIENLEARDSSAETEIEKLRTAEDLNSESEASENEMKKGTEKHVDITSSIVEEPEEKIKEENIEADIFTDTPPVTLVMKTSSEEVQQGEQLIKGSDNTSNDENLEIKIAHKSQEDEEVDRAKLEQTSSMVPQISTEQHAFVGKENVIAEKPKANEDKAEEIITSDSVMASIDKDPKDAIDTDEIQEETNEVPESIAEEKEVAKDFMSTDSFPIEELSAELQRVDAQQKTEECVTGAGRPVMDSPQVSIATYVDNENLPQETNEEKNVKETPIEPELQPMGEEPECTKITAETIVLSKENLETVVPHEEVIFANEDVADAQIDESVPDTNKSKTGENKDRNLEFTVEKITGQDFVEDQSETNEEVEHKLEEQKEETQDGYEMTKDVILVEKAVVELQEVEEIGNIRGDIMEEGSCIKELKTASESDENIAEIIKSDPTPVENLEVVRADTEEEKLLAAEDPSWKSGILFATKEPEEDMKQGMEKSNYHTNSEFEGSENTIEEENMEKADADTNKGSEILNDPDADETEVEKSISFEALSKYNEHDVEDIQRNGEIATAVSIGMQKFEGVSESELKHQASEAVVEGDKIPDPHPATNLTEKLPEPFSNMLPTEQDWETTTPTEKVEDESQKKDETLVNKCVEDTPSSGTVKAAVLSKENPMELQVSPFGFEFDAAKQNESPNEAAKEERTVVEEAAAVEPQVEDSLVTVAEEAAAVEPQVEDSLVTVAEEAAAVEPQVEDSLIPIPLDIPRNEGEICKEVPIQDSQKAEKVLDSMSEAPSPNAVAKSEVTEIEEEYHKTAPRSMNEENLSEITNETTGTIKKEEPSEKTNVDKEVAKDSMAVSADEKIRSSYHEDELEALEYPGELTSQKLETTKMSSEELEKAVPTRDIEEHNVAVEEVYQDSLGDRTVSEILPEEINDGKNVKEAPMELRTESDLAAELKNNRAEIGEEKIMVDEKKEQTEKPESAMESLSQLLRRSTKGTSQMATTLIEESESTDKKGDHQPDKSATDKKEDHQPDKSETDEGKGAHKVEGKEEEEEEGNKNQKVDSGSDAPVMVEASRDIDVKVCKKSHGILSGVGSKVKHSISKVKKVITGKSSHSKPLSPK